MTSYDTLETSPAEGRPYFLYQFAEGAAFWRFTSRAEDWAAPAGAIVGEPNETVWTASALSHGPVVQSSDPRRVDLSLTFTISDLFARRYLGPRSRAVTTLTIFRGHEQVPMEVVAHWKGRVVSARTEGPRIILRCESLFTAMRREGVRASMISTCPPPKKDAPSRWCLALCYCADPMWSGRVISRSIRSANPEARSERTRRHDT